MKKWHLRTFAQLETSPARHRIFQTWVEDHVKGRKKLSLLDWGCGPGTCIEMFYQKYPDGDFHMADIADKRRHHQDKPFYILEPDTPSLQLPSGSIDVIVSSEVFEHVHNLTATIREIHRLLSPDGILVGSIPNFRNLASRISYLRGNLYRIGGRMDKGGHINFITPSFLQNFMSNQFDYVYQGGDIDWISWVDLVPSRFTVAAYKKMRFRGLLRENSRYSALSYDYLFGFKKKPLLSK